MTIAIHKTKIFARIDHSLYYLHIMLTSVSEATGTLIIDLFGPLCKEGGLFLGDEFKALRFRQAQRLKKITERADEVLKLNGSPVHHPSDSLLLNMIQFASLVDSSLLQDHWAMLLAKEASGCDIHPRFPRILADLSPADAQILDTLDQQKYKFRFTAFDLKHTHKVEEKVIQQTIDNLRHLGLLDEPQRTDPSRLNSRGGIGLPASPTPAYPPGPHSGFAVQIPSYKLTELGHAFLAAIRGPLPPDGADCPQP
jgi:hypothetical protein